MNIRLPITFFLGVLASCQILPAAVIVSTFTNTPPGYTGDSYQISFTSFTFVQSVQWAMGFTIPSGADYHFTGFEVPLAFPQGATTVNFTIASAGSAGAPGAALETLSISGSSSVTAVYTGSSILEPILLGGQAYWLEAAISSSDPNTAATWNAAAGILSGMSQGPVGSRNVAFPPLGHDWSVTTGTQAAFEIDGIALPEPATGSTFAVLGLLAHVARLFRLRTRS